MKRIVLSPAQIVVARAALLSAVALAVPYALSGLIAPIASATGWGRSELGLAFGIGLAASTAAAVLAGAAVDRLRDARILLVGAGAATLAGLLGAAASSDPLMFALAFGCLTGAGSGVLTIVAYAPLAALPGPSGRAYGIAFAGGGLGTAAAVPGVAALATALGWRAALVVLAGTATAVLAPLLAVPLETPSQLGGDDGRSLSKRRLAALLVAIALFAFADETGFENTAALAAAAGLTGPAAALLAMLVAAGFAAGVYAGGELSDRIGRLPVLVGGGVLVAGSLLLLAGLVLPAAAAPVFGLALGGVVAARWAWAADAFPARAAGRVAGLTQIAYAAGGGPAGYLGGRAYETTGGYGPVFVAAAAAALLWTGVIALTVSRDARRRAARPIVRVAVAVRAR